MLFHIRHRRLSVLGLIGVFLGLGVFLMFHSRIRGGAFEDQAGAPPKLAHPLADLARVMPQERTQLAEGERAAPPAEFAMEKLSKPAQDAVRARLMRINHNAEVQVYIHVTEISEANRRELRAAGARLELEDAKRGIIQAQVPVTRLAMVADLPFVRHVSLPNYARHHIGSVTTEGDSILKADQVRSTLHVDGTGVKVGVISDGLKGIFATACRTCTGVAGGPISTSDLPSATGTRNAAGVLISSSGGITGQSFQANGDLEGLPGMPCGFPGAGAEGTALLEIVHDIAPGAQLSFANADTDIAFNQAVNFLAANNDIVMDDFGFFAEPYDGTSSVSSNTADALNNSSNRIRAYFTAVGNEADGHYLGAYVDSKIDGTTIGTSPALPAGHVHLFQGTTTPPITKDVLGLGPLVRDRIRLQANGEVVIFLQWDDPFGASTNDYDLYLINHSTNSVVASSTAAPFNGNPGGRCVITTPQDPVQCLVFTNPDMTTGATDDFDIVIQNPGNRAAVKNLNMFVFTPECSFGGLRSLAPTKEKTAYNTASSSVPAESDAGGSPVSVTSVGAICSGSMAAANINPVSCNDPNYDQIEFFSSIGPTLDGRMKPDVSGIDGVSVTGAGGFGSPFFGSSAATPHAAGVAALLLETAPCLRNGARGAVDNTTARTNLRRLVLNNAVPLPLGTSPPNDVFGHGRIDALASANQTIPAPTGITTQTVGGNTATGASVDLSGTAFRDPDSCPLTFNFSGACGSGFGATLNCPFGTSAVTAKATNNGVTFSPSADVEITITNFALALSAAQATVKAGGSTNITVTVTPIGGSYPNAVTLGCTGLPALSTCFPASVTPGASAAMATITLSTTAPTAVPPSPFSWRPGALFPLSAVIFGLALAGVFLARRERQSGGRRVLVPAGVGLALLAQVAIQMACGGGSGPQHMPGTAPGSYTVTVTGTHGTLVQSKPFSLTVQ